jgi:hypothetical protein
MMAEDLDSAREAAPCPLGAECGLAALQAERDGDSGPERYRCVVCWGAVCWCVGGDDAQERALRGLVDQDVFVDGERISDGGLCDACWGGLGGERLVVEGIDPYEDLDEDLEEDRP